MKTMFLISAVLLAAACGGGKSDPDAPPIDRIDARPRPDAMQVGCSLETNITELPADGANSAVFRTDDGATPPVEIELWNWAVTGLDAVPDLFQFVIDIPAAPLDTPLQLVQACTAEVTFCMVGLGDFDPNTMTERQFFYPNTGTITISELGDVGGNFTVTMTEARFDEYEEAGGAQVDADGDGVSECNGSTPAFGPITFIVAAPTVAPQSGVTGSKWGKFERKPKH